MCIYISVGVCVYVCMHVCIPYKGEISRYNIFPVFLRIYLSTQKLPHKNLTPSNFTHVIWPSTKICIDRIREIIIQTILLYSICTCEPAVLTRCPRPTKGLLPNYRACGLVVDVKVACAPSQQLTGPLDHTPAGREGKRGGEREGEREGGRGRGREKEREWGESNT